MKAFLCWPLLVALSAHGGAPLVTVTPSGPATLTLTWTGSGVLERSTQIKGPWEAIPGASSGWQTDTNPQQTYYRVRSAFPLDIGLAGDGTGVVHSAALGWECHSDCRRWLDEGSEIELTATADDGSVFVGWTGDFVGEGTCVFTMDAPKQVTATFSPSTPPSGFVNGDFEQGPEVGWIQEPSNMIYTAQELGVPPYSGNYAAWVGYHPDNRKSAAIGQYVSLPLTWPLYLNFAIWLYSEELCDPPWWDTFGVYVGGEAIEENARVCSGNTGGDGWRRVSLDLSAYAGQTVPIVFAISSVDTLASVALIDEVFLDNSPW